MITDPEHKIHTAICPLCGGPNLCALAEDPDASECWCDTEEFPRELLEKIPANAVRRTCVCKRCLEKHRRSANSHDPSP